MINVTKTYLPNKGKYQKYLDEIYANRWITNNGPLAQRLENDWLNSLVLKTELKRVFGLL